MDERAIDDNPLLSIRCVNAEALQRLRDNANREVEDSRLAGLPAAQLGG